MMPKQPQTLGDTPLEEKYRVQMNVVAAALDEVFNGKDKGAARDTGFLLLVFPYGTADGTRCNFISNGANRDDLVVLFREMIARFEGQAQVTGRA